MCDWQANPKDADQIFSAIDWRVQQLKVREQASDDTNVQSIRADSTVVESTTASQAEKRSNEDSLEETVAPTKKARCVNHVSFY